jgi:hypothetical protein
MTDPDLARKAYVATTISWGEALKALEWMVEHPSDKTRFSVVDSVRLNALAVQVNWFVQESKNPLEVADEKQQSSQDTGT